MIEETEQKHVFKKKTQNTAASLSLQTSNTEIAPN